MSCVECGYGTAGSCKHNSYIGQKVGTGKTATKYWGNKFFTSKTSEEYTVGTHTVITSAFRSYEDMQQCFNNYYELLNTKLYSRVKAGVDYKTQMSQIKSCGYMTSSTEVSSVLYIINKYNLTQYDNVNIVKNLTFKVGNFYTLTSNLNIRVGAGTNYKKVAVLNKGTTIEATQIINVDSDIWIGCKYGYIIGKIGDKYYVQ